MIIDLTAPVQSSRDPVALTAILSALVGQPCLKAGLSYSEELMIHFGAPAAYAHPMFAGEKKGAWILGARASGWRLLLPDPPVIIEAGWHAGLHHWPGALGQAIAPARCEHVGEEKFEQTLARLAGETLSFARPFPLSLLAAGGVGLMLGFTNGANLVVCPNPEPDDDGESLADWELFTPYHTYLRCGPGLVWSYLPSDEVAGPKQENVA
jgi:hypothetical protein